MFFRQLRDARQALGCVRLLRLLALAQSLRLCSGLSGRVATHRGDVQDKQGDAAVDVGAVPSYEEWLGHSPESDAGEPYLLDEDAGEQYELGGDDVDVGTIPENLSIRCPPFMVNRPVATIKQRMIEGRPVISQKEASAPEQQETVFVIAHPFTGSTALLGLLATSPRATSHCRSSPWACEGTWLLVKEGLLTHENRWRSDWPRDWADAWHVYTRYWNMSRPVLLEKSPPNVVKITEIAEGMRKLGQKASFIVMTHSPCNMGKQRHYRYKPKKFERFVADMSSGALRDDGLVRFLRLKYEDLLADPWAVSQQIVDFIPQLGSINPAETAPDLRGQSWDGRADSVASYVVGLGDSRPAARDAVGEGWRKYMEVGGYL